MEQGSQLVASSCGPKPGPPRSCVRATCWAIAMATISPCPPDQWDGTTMFTPGATSRWV